VAALATAALTLACGEDETDATTSTALAGGAGTPAAGGAEATTVDVKLVDFGIALGESSAASGEVTFDITNDGPSEHEFIVLKTDLPADALPMTDDTVDEEADGIGVIDEVEEIADGETGTLDVDSPRQVSSSATSRSTRQGHARDAHRPLPRRHIHARSLKSLLTTC
jgi:hypothetical protein